MSVGILKKISLVFILVGEHVKLIKSRDPISLILSELSIGSRNEYKLVSK